MQVVILVVDQQQRPDLPQDLMALPGKPLGSPGPYLDLMQQCWATDPAQRPSFERVISALRCLSRPCSSCAVKNRAQRQEHILQCMKAGIMASARTEPALLPAISFPMVSFAIMSCRCAVC